jgi:hypothetical protein
LIPLFIQGISTAECTAYVLARRAIRTDDCKQDCIQRCGRGESDTCDPPVAASAGLAPPAIALSNGGQPSGCGCVGSDTCCPCSGFLEGGSDVGLCCIYIDCRCCPGAA